MLAGLLVLALFAFSFASNALSSLFDFGYKSPYTWSNLQWENGAPFYTENGKPASLLGVDVSAYDKSIDWDAVASDGTATPRAA